MSELKPMNDLYSALKTNRIITLAAVAMATLSIVMSIGFAYYSYSFSINNVLFVTHEGKVIPAELVERSTLAEIEIKRHLDLWFDSYYTYDQNNLNAQREAGLWLINSEDGARLEGHYEKSWFKEVLQNNISQVAELIPNSVVIRGNQEPYEFQASAMVKIRKGNSDAYTAFKLDVSGRIVYVSPNYPLNPNGLMILDYAENPLTEIELP